MVSTFSGSLIALVCPSRMTCQHPSWFDHSLDLNIIQNFNIDVFETACSIYIQLSCSQKYFPFAKIFLNLISPAINQNPNRVCTTSVFTNLAYFIVSNFIIKKINKLLQYFIMRYWESKCIEYACRDQPLQTLQVFSLFDYMLFGYCIKLV